MTERRGFLSLEESEEFSQLNSTSLPEPTSEGRAEGSSDPLRSRGPTAEFLHLDQTSLNRSTDEFDLVDKSNALKRADDGSYLVEGAMTIRDLNRATDWNLPDDEANTVAGLVIHEAQMIPVQGQAFSFHGFRFEVVARRENRLTRIRIRKL